MEKDIAIKVENVSKTFKIPHEKISSIRGAFVNMFQKKTYEEFKALNDVSFEVKKGEFFGIIGRNGSGKSTLLKILAGIYQPDTPVKSTKGGPAKREFHGVKINGLISPFLELGIGFNPELSGRDNIYLNATVLGLTKKQIDHKFNDIVAFSELERFIDQKLKNYSSGMQVRLAFSVAIHANRDILLMDEVLAVGDTNFQSKCLTEFNRYKELGKTVILVTHDISTVQRYCDRAMLLRNGRIVKIGKAEEVGNAYVYENMSDEEKRIEEDEKQKLIQAEENLKKLKGRELEIEKKRIELEKAKHEEKRKSKVAEITKVKFLDENSKERHVFRTGDNLKIRVYFSKNQTNILNFGIALFNIENNCILGVNTFFDKIDTQKYLGKNYFQLNFYNIPLKSNTYFIKAGIWGDLLTMQYDFLHKSNTFKIISCDRNQGMVAMQYKWQ